MFNLTWFGLAGRHCLDGQAAGYYWRDPWINHNSQQVETVIYFEGGGWCYGLNEQETIDDCARKRKSWRGLERSSEHWTSWPMTLPWYLQELSSDRNFMYVPNCDWTSLTGTSGEVNVTKSDGTNKTLYFEGFNILNDALDSIKPYIIPQITETSNKPLVIVSGGSAGGSAVYYHADFIQEKFNDAKIVAFPDAAFFLDLPALNGTDIWPEQMRQMAKIAHSRFPTCDKESQCLFPEYFANLTTVPFFVLNSLYDTSELWYTLYLSCYPWTEECPLVERVALCRLGNQHEAALNRLMEKNSTGVFLTNALRHSQMGTRHTINNTTLHEAFNAWLRGDVVRLTDVARSTCLSLADMDTNGIQQLI
eukprot:GEMP01029412.1.p1 GENE.GEMP01029412.1~~GEMP01029412.1.p1  ORF type:complete len:364 (+),score=74.10 GEMP01029412.1:64-1155(+)